MLLLLGYYCNHNNNNNHQHYHHVCNSVSSRSEINNPLISSKTTERHGQVVTDLN
jgi:hypothetical protein